VFYYYFKSFIAFPAIFFLCKNKKKSHVLYLAPYFKNEK